MDWSSLNSNTFLHWHSVTRWTLFSGYSWNSSNQPVNRMDFTKTKRKIKSVINQFKIVQGWTWSGSKTSRQNVATGPEEGSRKNSSGDCSLRQGRPGLGPKYCSLDFIALANHNFSLCCIMNLKIWANSKQIQEIEC